MSCAVERRIAATWNAVSVGRTVQSHAAAALTIGAEKLVPFSVSSPLAFRHVGTAARMSTPGATRSMLCDTLEKDATASFSSVEPTLITCGSDAGETLAPDAPPLPADATTRQPLCCAVAIASASDTSRIDASKLRLITRGQCCAVAVIAATAAGTLRSPPGLMSQISSAACG